MIISIILGLIISTTFIPIFINTPTMMVFLVLLLTILILGMSSLLTPSWIIIITFLIFVGGIIIAFTYFLTITPNTNQSTLTITLLFFSNALFVFATFYKYLSLQNFYLISPSITFIIANINLLTIILITLALLLVLISVVSNTSINHSPLRSYN